MMADYIPSVLQTVPAISTVRALKNAIEVLEHADFSWMDEAQKEFDESGTRWVMSNRCQVAIDDLKMMLNAVRT